MTAKEFLKRYEYADLRAKRYEDEYKLEHELIGSISINYDGMPHGNGISRKTENDALKLAEKAERCVTARLDAIRVRQEVFDLISDIDGVEGEILYQRYIKLLKWEAVCIVVHLSWYAVNDHHKKALAIVQNRLDKMSI
jgi:hypothetical protein